MSLDLAIGVLFLVGVLWGLWRGLIKQVASLVGWLLAAVVVWLWAPALARSMEGFVGGAFAPRWGLAAVVLGISARVAGDAIFTLFARSSLDRLLAERDVDGNLYSGRLRRRFWDALLGAVLGATKAALVLWIGLSLMAVVMTGLKEFGVSPTIENAHSYDFAQRHNAALLLASPQLEKLVLSLREVAGELEVASAGGSTDSASASAESGVQGLEELGKGLLAQLGEQASDRPAAADSGLNSDAKEGSGQKGKAGQKKEAAPGASPSDRPKDALPTALERLARDSSVSRAVSDPGLLESIKSGNWKALKDLAPLQDFFVQPGAMEKLGAAFDEALEWGGVKSMWAEASRSLGSED